MTSQIASSVAVKGEGSVAGDGKVIGAPKFHSWGKCTMPLTNINSDWMSNASSDCELFIRESVDSLYKGWRRRAIYATVI